MSSIYSGRIGISIFGESHGAAIGAVLDGIPAGEKIDFEQVYLQMQRRAPGMSDTATERKESDRPKVISGVTNGYTTGAPICGIIENENAKSKSYENLKNLVRPGHSDYTAHVKYRGFNDARGGGHLSGRLTAALTFCGTICRQILERRGVLIGAHVYSIFDVFDGQFGVKIPAELLRRLSQETFPVINAAAKEKMVQKILWAKSEGDSIGGIIECAVDNVPPGLGDPIFGGIESKLSALVFAIPAVKGIEFGAGFAAAQMFGSQNNDAFVMGGGKISTKTNNHGGILGGISSGMPIVFRCAVKPTPSIAKQQDTVNVQTNQPAKISASGRHDPCIVPRAVPVVEAVSAIAILDFFKEANLL
mgnify:CR=1 FL=1